jgi:hypothetical protein
LAPKPKFPIGAKDKKDWLDKFSGYFWCLWPDTSHNDASRLDTMAQAFISAAEAAQATFREEGKHPSIGNAWFSSPKCKDTAKVWCNSTFSVDADKNMRKFKAVARKAKCDHYTQCTIDTDHNTLWQLAHQIKGRCLKMVSALKCRSSLAVSPKDQAHVLSEAWFPSKLPGASVCTSFNPDACKAWEWPPFTPQELSAAISGTSNTLAPGSSGIRYCLIKWIHECFQDQILEMYNLSWSCSHVPSLWKSVVIIPIPKPRKMDMSSSHSNRPIALLETFSKLLEKMIALHMQHDSCKYGLIPSSQFSGIMGVGCNDAGLSLIHTIQNGFTLNQAMVVLAFNIVGFFDNIHHEHMCHVLSLLGYPFQLSHWIHSFLLTKLIAFSLVLIPPLADTSMVGEFCKVHHMVTDTCFQMPQPFYAYGTVYR